MIVNSVEPMQIDDVDNSDHVVLSSSGIPMITTDNSAAAALSSVVPANLKHATQPLTNDQPLLNGEASLPADFKVCNCSIDLDTYSMQYQDLFRVHRLLFIAEHCPPLKTDALILALKNIENTNNVEMYKKIHVSLNEISASSSTNEGTSGSNDVTSSSSAGGGGGGSTTERSMPKYDRQWVEDASRNSTNRFEKLDADLRSYKSNSIKESIRRGHTDMGKHFLVTGDLQSALKSFSRTRDYCTSSKHILEMCYNVIGVNILLKNWFHVQSFVMKAEQTHEQSQDNQHKKMLAKTAWLKCAYGVAELAFKRYRSAAKAFIAISPENCPEDFVSPSNVALYGGLCALACYDRDELHSNVITNASFKQLVEAEPQLREVMLSFYSSNYTRCFSIMDEMRNNCILDMYISSHVDTLYQMIRERALCQYFGSYSSIDMHRMASAFNTSVDSLQEELSVLIQNDAINGRIDSHNKVLYAREVNQRTATFEKALELGQEFERKSTAMLAKCALVKAKILVSWKQTGEQVVSQPGILGGNVFPSSTSAVLGS